MGGTTRRLASLGLAACLSLVGTPALAQPSTPDTEALTLQNPRVWSGLVGYPVNLQLYGGGRVQGRLMGQHVGGLLVARASDGRVINVDRANVQRASVHVEQPKPEVRVAPGIRKGRGLIGVGATMIFLGGPVFVTGIVFLAISHEYLALTLPMILTGGPVLAGGVGMTAVGVERRDYWRQATSEYAMGFGRDFPNLPRGMSFEF